MMKLKMQATKDSTESAMALKKEEQKLVMEHDKIISEIHLSRKKRLAEIESSKMERIIECLGKDTLVAMARSGNDCQIKMLQGLGLKGYLLTDGESPVNLFNAANQMVGMQQK